MQKQKLCFFFLAINIKSKARLSFSTPDSPAKTMHVLFLRVKPTSRSYAVSTVH